MDKDFLKEVEKNLDLDVKKKDLIKFVYYGASVLLLLFPLYQANIFGFKYSLNGFQVFSSGLGLLYFVVILGGIATLFVKMLKSYEDMVYMVAPVVVLVLLFIINDSASEFGSLAEVGMGFWGLLLLNIAAVGYKWYPTVLKMINDKKVETEK